MVALDPLDGSTLWAQNYDALGAALPQLPPVPPFFPTGQPIVRFNSVVSTSAQKVWVVLTAGYEFFNPAAGTSRLQPRVTLLAALDPVDGSVISTTPLRDTNEGVVTFGSDGSIYTDHSAILSSVFFYGINPLLQGAGLPAPYLAPGPPPGGVTSLGPVSLVDHLVESIEWVQSLNTSALAELPGGDVDAALTATRRGRTQLQATLESVDDAVDSGELDAATASALKLKLHVAAGLINNARTLLATNNPTVAKQQNAAREADPRERGARRGACASVTLTEAASRSIWRLPMTHEQLAVGRDMTSSILKVEQHGAVRLLTIDDPPWNVMSVAFMNDLEREVSAIAADDATRAVVITGSGDANFSAGMNLKEVVAILGNQAAFDELLDQRLRVLSAIENMAKPWVVTLFGHCLGGGLELPLACHFRIAAEEGAKIGLPEMDLGSVPAWGGSARLTRCVGRDHALDMILRGLKISGPRARRSAS